MNYKFCLSTKGLNQALLLGFYLSFVTFSTVLAAPSAHRRMSIFDEHMKWVNPCGRGTDQPDGGPHSGPSVSEKELITRIVNQANIAYTKAKDFKEKFALQTFNMKPEELHQLWHNFAYEWLPSQQEVPKHLEESVPPAHLKTLDVDTALLNTYEYLQKIAVGIEQIVWDKVHNGNTFVAEFKEAENYLLTVLCEIQNAIFERNLTRRPDVQRDIMPSEFRSNIDNTNINIRNWVIYRDYMNVLEYVIQTFGHLKSK